MNPISEQQGAVIKQAIEWRQLLDQGELDEVLRREFSAWLQSPTNAEELARLCLIDALLKNVPLTGGKRPLPENVIDFQYYAPAPRPRISQLPVVASAASRFTKKIAIAASVTIAVLVVALVGVLTKDPVIVTNEGRWDKQLLEDGSIVYAGPNTRLSFDFDAERRAVTLLRGEALFEVAKEPGRPFIVTTEAGSVQALGTVFATADIGDEVVVTVASGKVGVRSIAAEAQPLLPLSANQQVVLSSIGISEPMAVNAERELKWIRNWYEYDGEQVGEIIEQLNRRNEVKVVVDDRQVTRLRVSSLAFKPSEPEQLVARINRWYADYPQKAGDQARDPAGRRGAVLHLERP